jgi:hypothetical protein
MQRSAFLTGMLFKDIGDQSPRMFDFHSLFIGKRFMIDKVRAFKLIGHEIDITKLTGGAVSFHFTHNLLLSGFVADV